ncbi:MAG: hypothetical protein KDB03_03075 [Planctomycetales bacterium]|nr:hypothetical protein [Planctomycetales bacterium]
MKRTARLCTASQLNGFMYDLTRDTTRLNWSTARRPRSTRGLNLLARLRQFESYACVPFDLDHVDVVARHEGGGPKMRIIGDAASLLHRPTVIWVASER